MGKEGLRYAAKVDLEKDAGTLPYLHVSKQSMPTLMDGTAMVVPKDKLHLANRTETEPVAPGQ